MRHLITKPYRMGTEARVPRMESQKLCSLKGTAKPIASMQSLCRTLDVSLKEFRTALLLPDSVRFVRIPEKRKPDGSIRNILNPHPLIRKIQRRLVSRVLSRPSVFHWP